MGKGTLAFLGCFGIVALLFVWPVVSFVIGAFTGWLASSVFVFFGRWIVSGLTLFGLHVELADLPLLTATLGFVGGFFKSYSSNSNK